MIDSITFPMTAGRLTGLFLPGVVLLPFLGIGVADLIFQLLGR